MPQGEFRITGPGVYRQRDGGPAVNYIVQQAGDGCWTVGRYTAPTVWEPESDHSSEDAAKVRAIGLNCGDVLPRAITTVEYLERLSDRRHFCYSPSGVKLRIGPTMLAKIDEIHAEAKRAVAMLRQIGGQP